MSESPIDQRAAQEGADQRPAGSAQSEVGALASFVVKPVVNAFIDQRTIDAQWRALFFNSAPEMSPAIAEHERFVGLLESLGAEARVLPRVDGVTLDSIYVRDASVVSDRGVVLCRMGKEARRGEPAAQAEAFRAWGIPVLGEISGEGRLEGGDVVWLDRRTIAVGRGYRSNDEGIAQLQRLLADVCDEVFVVPLPHWQGPQDVFHLMSILSPVDIDLAVVYSPLMPVPFRETLLARGIELVEVPESEFVTMGANVLAVGPRRCVMVEGNPETKRRLEKAGADVHEYRGREISLKGGGGPTCLTRPLWRALPGSSG